MTGRSSRAPSRSDSPRPGDFVGRTVAALNHAVNVCFGSEADIPPPKDSCNIFNMYRRLSRPAFAALLLLSGCTNHRIAAGGDGSAAALEAWAEFSIRPSLARPVTGTTVQIGDLPFAAAGERTEHWLRKTTAFFGGATRVEWTDTRSCAAARLVLSNMYALDMPRPAQGGVIEVRADGILYALSTDGRYENGRLARLSISAPGGTPLADWAERSLAQLESCWSDLAPTDIRQGLPINRR